MFKGSNHAELKDAEREHKDTKRWLSAPTERSQPKIKRDLFVLSVNIHSFIVSILAMICKAQRATDELETHKHVSLIAFSASAEFKSLTTAILQLV